LKNKATGNTKNLEILYDRTKDRVGWKSNEDAAPPRLPGGSTKARDGLPNL
jgi:hypothetical protein